MCNGDNILVVKYELKQVNSKAKAKMIFTPKTSLLRVKNFLKILIFFTCFKQKILFGFR